MGLLTQLSESRILQDETKGNKYGKSGAVRQNKNWKFGRNLKILRNRPQNYKGGEGF